MIGLGQTLRGEARDSVIFAGSNLLNRLGALVLLPLYWSKLTPADYGVLAVIGVFGAFQTLLSSMSLDLGVTRFYYEWAEDLRRRNLGAIWIWNLVLTLAVTLAFVLIVPILGPALFPEVTDPSWFVLGVLGNAGSNLFIIPASTIRIKRLPWLFATYNLLGFALASGLGLWLVLGLDLGLTGLLVSTLAANLILAVFGEIAMLRFSTPAFSSPGLREAVRFSAHAVPSALITTSASILDRFLLGLFTNLHTLGLYSVASRFVDVLNALHSALKMSYGPFLMKNVSGSEGTRGMALVVAITPYYLIPYFVVGLGLSLFIGPVVQLIGQPEYFGVETIVPWLVGIQILVCLSAYIANGITLAKRTELLSIPAAVSTVVLAASSLVLIGPFQLAGIIVSRYASVIAFLGLSLYISQKVFPMGHKWAAIVQLAITATAFTVIGQVAQEGGVWEVPVKVLLWCAYIGLAWWIVGRAARAPVSPSASGAPA